MTFIKHIYHPYRYTRLSIILLSFASCISSSPGQKVNSSVLNTDYGLLESSNHHIIKTLNRAKNGIYKCTVNNKTHIADVKGYWGEKSWINDLYFGLNGGLYVADELQQEVFMRELRKISKFILHDDSKYEIVPYAVDSSGNSCDRNISEGMDYDRCAEFILCTIRLYEFTGNIDFLKEMYPIDLRIINWLKKQNHDHDILIEGRSLPIPITGVGSCVSSTYIGDAVKNDFKDFGANLFYYKALRSLAEAETILGQMPAAKNHSLLADSLQKEMNRIMWNEGSKGYLGWIDKNYVEHTNWITGNNADAVYCGLSDNHQDSLIMERLKANKMQLIDIVPCRSIIDTFMTGYSSNSANYYWNGGCWPLIAAPVMLAYRKMGNLQGAKHIIDVLSTKAATTKYGFYESYWGNTGQPNGIKGLLMNNGGVLWGFFQGVLGVNIHGDALIFQDRVPINILPAKMRLRYRGADIVIRWMLSNNSRATLNNKTIEKCGNSYILRLKPLPGKVIHIEIEVPA